MADVQQVPGYSTAAPNCWFCGVRLVMDRNHPRERTRDHLHPRSRGGSNRRFNCVAASRTCNTRKGAKTVDEFRQYVELLSPYRRALEALNGLPRPVHKDVEKARMWIATQITEVVFFGEGGFGWSWEEITS